MATSARRRHPLFALLGSMLILVGLIPASPVMADNTAQSLPFSQNWSNTGLLTTDDIWTGVPGIDGFRGDGLVAATAVDPQTVLADGGLTPLDVNVDETSPNTFTTGGIAEFHITDPVVAFQGSGTADAPHLVITLNTTGAPNVNVSYNLRDIDGAADNAVQPVALQYRIGTSGSYTNIPAAFVPDASTGPSLATLVTPVSVGLPAAAANQAVVQLRIITTDAVGSDELIGVDDISVVAADAAPTVATVPANGATGVPTNTTPSITFSEPVTFGPTGPSPDPLTLVCTNQGTKVGTLTDAGDADPATYQFVVAPFLQGDHCVLTIKAANVSDIDTDDPPDAMAANHVAAFDIFAPVVTPDLVINEIDYDQPGTDFAEFVEIRNNGESAVNLDAVQVDLVNGNGGGAAIYQTVDLPNVSLAAGDYFVICGNPSTTPNCDLDGGSDTALLQNGDPDAVGLRVGATVFDAISYVGNTGAPYTEGSGGAPDDPQVDFRSLSRCPDGADTDQNNVDVVIRSSTPGTVNACLDDGPVVATTAPSNGSFGVDPGTDIAITFSEAVNVAGGNWFSIVCSSSGVHGATVVGGPITFGLQTAVDFTPAESCTVSILAAGVTDQDATDPPDNMPFDHVFSFTIVAPSGCELAATHQIWEVQGAGTSTPVAGQQVRVEGVVTGDFQGSTALNGFFIQDNTPDVDPLTSDGIFVFSNIEVAEGDLVRATGTAIEFNGLTELSPVTAVDICGTGTIAPASYDLPRPSGTTFEPVEGVLVAFPEALTATEHFQLGRFGEVTVSSDGRLFQPTDRVAPGAPAQAELELANRRRLLIDDGSNVQNPAFVPYLTPEAVRIGDTATGITGVMSFGFGLYRLQPTETITFARTNPRPPAPANVGGDVQVASFNTLNYFTTLANDNPNARGANNATEFQRQQAKEVAAILGIDADVLGLMEVENNGATAIGSLVDALNATAGAGTYAYITEPAISPPNEFGGTFGTDAIKVAIIYKPAVVTPVGAAQTSADPIFDRPPLIQTFSPVGGGESFTVVVNHFKSKNCAAGSPLEDTDQGDGQSCFNGRRVLQAEKLVEVLDVLDTPNTLVIGDLNAYTEEDPIHVLEDAGYVGLSEEFIPAASRYSFVFDGFSGELDHGLAAPELADNVTGATIWHINADEPLILDYNTEFNPPGLYQPNAYRTSDHDPLIVGLTLNITPIHEIQGAAHLSPVVGTNVSTTGIVTGLSTTTTLGRGFYIQDPNPDANVATSEGIFVFTSVAPTVSVGDSVLVNGLVAEFRPGGATSNNLTKTQLTNPTILVQSTGNPLPPTTVIGLGGRVPPTMVIDDDATGDVETSGTFDAATDGIDFYESLEGMRVQVNNPVAVGPTTSNREISVLADDGAGAALRTYRGGIIVRPTDFNPERIQLDDTLLANSTPNASVGDHFSGPAVGIVDYNFSNFEINLTSALTTVSAGLAREVATAPGANELVMATYNVENLTVNDAQAKFDNLASQIVNNLLSPDVIAIEEIQDDNGTAGTTGSLVVDADQTFAKLIAAIDAADPAPGPVYDYRQINPVAHQDGGAPGGNIRVGFLFRTDRGLAFVDRPGGGSTDATTIVNNGGTPELSFSPGRVAPNDSAWLASRKPLAGEFTYRGQTFFLIANHFNSKSADQPLFGRFQPPIRTTEAQRHQQAQLVNDFVDAILAVDANANIVVLGDINDFEFSETMNILTAGDSVLHDLMNELPPDQRYSYVFEGNSQTLDHIIVSSSLLATAPVFDPVHVNAEYFDQVSDHDPSVALFEVNDPPTVDAGGPYTVVEGSSVTVSATGDDPNGDLPLTYAWDLDNNGSFETPGQSATFTAPANSAPASPTIRVRVTDSTGLTAIDTATVNIIWSFSGFFAPLANPPTENVINAGSGVPIKFSLGGNQGLNVIAAGYPRSIEYTCGTAEGLRPLDATAPTQTLGFTYSAATNSYTYTWKTQKQWMNTCRRFVLKLTDGTYHYVDIKFVK